jgi:hypothetical protein
MNFTLIYSFITLTLILLVATNVERVFSVMNIVIN